jgi:hypothetical protein
MRLAALLCLVACAEPFDPSGSWMGGARWETECEGRQYPNHIHSPVERTVEIDSETLTISSNCGDLTATLDADTETAAVEPKSCEPARGWATMRVTGGELRRNAARAGHLELELRVEGTEAESGRACVRRVVEWLEPD